jgi:DNA replication protein DnaC
MPMMQSMIVRRIIKMIKKDDLYIQISTLFKDLNLDFTLEEFVKLSSDNKTKKETIIFFKDALEELKNKKKLKNIEHLRKISKIPTHKRLDNFNFDFQESLDKNLIDKLTTLQFIHSHENILFISNPSMGKTHLAIGIGEICIEAGYRVLFTTEKAILSKLKKAQDDNKYGKILRSTYLNPAVLIIDEFGFMQLNNEETQMIFDIVDGRYEHSSIILTCNYNFPDWVTFFDSRMATKIITDCLFHHSEVLKMEGDKNYRLYDKSSSKN